MEPDIEISSDGGDVVRGRVVDDAGQPVEGVVVEAVSAMLRSEQVLGRAATDDEGRYKISYDPALLQGELVVRVVGDDARPGVEASARFDLSADEELEFVVSDEESAGRSEWEDVVAHVESHLDDLSPHDMTDDDVIFVSGATRRDPAELKRYADAHRLAQEASVPVDVVYVLLHQGVFGDLAALAAIGAEAIERAVERAIESGVAPADLSHRAAEAARRLREAEVEQPLALIRPEVLYATTSEVANGESEVAALVSDRLDAKLRGEVEQLLVDGASSAVERAIRSLVWQLRWQPVADGTIADVARAVLADAGRDPSVAAGVAQLRDRVGMTPGSSVQEVLALAVPLRDNPAVADDLTRAKAVEYARLARLGNEATQAVLERHSALFDPNGSVLMTLKDKGAISEAEASALRNVLDLGSLTADNVDLMRSLDAHGETSLPALASWDPSRWESLIAEANIRVPPGETAASYADRMIRKLETAYPTQALSARLPHPTLDAFFERNPYIDLRAVNLVERDGGGASVDWSGISDVARPEVEQRLRGYQRVLSLADTTTARAALLERGYDSAQKIVSAPEMEFLDDSGLSTQEARLTYVRAQHSTLKVAHAYAGINDIVRGLFKDFAVGNIAPELLNDLRRIDGFDDLFGSQDYCDCIHCRSVLSPAAYFVDLMHFVETNVSKPVFIKPPNRATHPLYLKTRRADLWTLKLTCENTNTLIPYLTIVNEVLEHFLNAVVVGGDIYKTLADPNEKVSFRVPISLPFAELRLYLSHFELAPADIYRTLRLPDAKVWRARLGLAPVEADVITGPPDEPGAISRFGITALPVDFEVQEFLRSTGLTREQLTSLLALRFNPDLQSITVAKDKTATPGEIQNFREVLKSLTGARVDFIHRLLRLWRATDWELAELDLLLLTLREQGLIGAGFDMTVIELLGELAQLQAELHLSVEELCALVGSLPVSPEYPKPAAGQADRRLYERLFNLEKLFGIDPATAAFNQSVTFHHYSLNTVNPNDTVVDPKTPLLLGALGITETELLRLFELLKDEMQFSTGGDCTLNRGRLSLLYRHVRIARALGLSIDDLVRALAVLFPSPLSAVLDSPARIEQLVSLSSWMGSAPFSAAALRFVLAGDDSGPVKFAATRDTVVQMVGEVQKIPAADRIKLGLRPRLAASFNVTAARLDDMLAWAATPVTDPSIKTAIDTALDPATGVPLNPADLDPLLKLVRQLERVNLLFTKLELADDTVAFVTSHPGALGIADLTKLTLRDIRSLSFYRALVTIRDGAEPAVQAVLDELGPGGTITSSDNLSRLADLWHVDRSLIDSLIDVFLPLPAGAAPIDALAKLSEALDVCRTLGVNAYSLQKLGDDSSAAALSTARDVALGAFNSKYDDEKVRATKLEPYLDQVNVLRRDAFCDYIIARQPLLKFSDRSEIYDYFLLDVEMSGCFRISRVVAAISSVQLYVQRCLVNLEQSDPDLNPSIPNVAVSPALIPRDRWDWRANYRVWEANRKVFLFPESYCFPDLRDNKTPIAKDLEDNLLQKKITKDAAADAYHTYMTQFSEQAHLKICGSYYHSPSDTYYFFGKTQQDPPVFYQRQWLSQTTWTPWEKVELAIDAPYVAAEIHLGRVYLFWVRAKTKEITNLKAGGASSGGYEVMVDLCYSYQRPSGTWTTPQKLPRLAPYATPPSSGPNTLASPADLANMELSKSYLKVYPKVVGDKIELRYHNQALNTAYVDYPDGVFTRELDIFRNKLLTAPAIPKPSPTKAVVLDYRTGYGTSSAQLAITTKAYQSDVAFDLELEEQPLTGATLPAITAPFPYLWLGLTDPERDYSMHLVHNGYPESVFTFGDQQYLVHANHFFSLDLGFVVDYGAFVGIVNHALVRLSTSRADDLGEKLMSEGLEPMLSLPMQRLVEKPLGITITDPSTLVPPADDPSHIDFRGAFGVYYREVFRDIPWVIAHHLNANQEFEAAKWWYERIFDPTSSESTTPETDRNWRFIEFRGLTMPTLKAILTDAAALKAYNEQPFNPHAIARLRPSAFQKAIVMQYVDNLLDWGDSLFSQDTIESINEATMLYVLALQILGKRPAKLGECETAPEDDLTYEKLGPQIDKGSEFLIMLENWTTLPGTNGQLLAGNGAEPNPSFSHPVSAVAHATLPAFCVPLNEELLKYWDRVEDRLYKIRHCMNISGVRRQLELFQPPIDPLALVRARAAGLSLEEALQDLDSPVPAYRFNYLIGTARQAVQTVQAFGSALLSALEKKDVEELTLLRSVHEQTVLNMTKTVKAQQVKEAEHTLQSVVEAKTNVENRISYYEGLIGSGLTGWEVTQQVSRHAATGIRVIESGLHLAAGIYYLIPNAGSPFAMTYGGHQLGTSGAEFAAWSQTMAGILEAVSVSAGLEATFQRRQQEWSQQLATAQQELKQVEQQRLAAEIRAGYAENELEIHNTTIDQAKELDQFYRNKFTNLGLYNYLATTLTRLHREAYNVAHELAVRAQRAYTFERSDDTKFITGDNWQFDKAGLLAGERLALQLEQLESSYLKKNTRDYEVTQSFSLALLNPDALVHLREAGNCEFSVPELLFDLAYPGQYRRLIKSVRVTIPCVAGPYTNVSAKLTLKSSSVRKAKTTNPADLLVLPAQERLELASAIATSSAQNDAGLFELNFRDERYLPFEGAGTVSHWGLELPAKLRAFNYDTISDVVIHMSYTALDDGVLRDSVEQKIVNDLKAYASTEGLHRLFSLRHDFPDAFQLLLHPTAGATQATAFDLGPEHFPYFLANLDVVISAVTLYVQPLGKTPINTTGLQMTVNGTAGSAWTTLTDTTLRTSSVSLSGPALKQWTAKVTGGKLDPKEVADVLVLIKYTVQ